MTLVGPRTTQLRLIARDRMVLAPGASIRAQGVGYGSNARHPSCSDGGARNGGMHGGGPEGKTCGDYEWPVLAGAGGSSGQHDGGSGGGSVMLVCNATESSAMELNGTVSVDGQSGRAFTSGSGSASGGGAGGSLLVVASRLSGSGTLSADGGAGADGYETDDSNGGSGGRIAIHAYQPSRSDFTGTVRARAGPAYGSWSPQAAAGTVYWCDGRVSESEAALEGEANAHRCGVRRLELDNGDLPETPYYPQLSIAGGRRRFVIDELHLETATNLSVQAPPDFDSVAAPGDRTSLSVSRMSGPGLSGSPLVAKNGTDWALGPDPALPVDEPFLLDLHSVGVEPLGRLKLASVTVTRRGMSLTVRGELTGVESLTLDRGTKAHLTSSGGSWVANVTDDTTGWKGWACAAERAACAVQTNGSIVRERGWYAFARLQLSGDASLVLDAGVQSLAAAELSMQGAATMTALGPRTTQLRLIARDRLILAPGASIRAQGVGYGSNARHPSCSDGGARNGGMHGGGPEGKTCGDYEWPVLAGAGGSSGQHDGGSGGGSVMLVCNATESSAMELNGTVSVDGQSGRAFTSGSGSASGGGAGGSLLVVASRLSGSGTLSADGGAGADGYSTLDSNGGSGGRIAIHAYQPSRSDFTGTVRARAGPAYGSWSPQAAAGTVYWCDGRVSESEAALEGEANAHRCGVRRLELDNGDLPETPYYPQLSIAGGRRRDRDESVGSGAA
ncbi:hypothetical protein FNF31_05471 [Cafeteria roenbergensis]|uniref:G8 domain-containing protein n=1 Tax=Cafeteria roenbergensis TaxID=33653 RepID=A0A5A8D0N2_CAFRO|nr:hypothetical protein FNF31_05471 [Cafeteria roenbergensis]